MKAWEKKCLKAWKIYASNMHSYCSLCDQYLDDTSGHVLQSHHLWIDILWVIANKFVNRKHSQNDSFVRLMQRYISLILYDSLSLSDLMNWARSSIDESDKSGSDWALAYFVNIGFYEPGTSRQKTHHALKSENLYINEFKLNLELYDNCTLLHDSYELRLIIKLCFNKNSH